MLTRRGVGIVHYNRPDNLVELIAAVKDTVRAGTKVVVCDDGSPTLPTLPQDTILLKGPNLGVGANKNRALWALQDCHYIALIEDDLFPTKQGWFEQYEEVSCLTETHHFCRMADEKAIPETYPALTEFLQTKGYTPIYGPSPRGDFTFITAKVIKEVGGFDPKFIGAGFAHGHWSERVIKAGLVPHPLKYWDVKEIRDTFIQKGDREGGRWLNLEKTKAEIRYNKGILKAIRESGGYTYHPLVLT